MLDFPYDSLKEYEKKLKKALVEAKNSMNTQETQPDINIKGLNDIFIPGSTFECLQGRLKPTFFQQFKQEAKYKMLYLQFLQSETPCQQNEDLIYIGQIHSQMAHGFGKIISKNGDTLFEGHFAFGKMHGPGRFIFSKGDIFDGKWFFNKILNGNYYDEKLKLHIKVQELYIEFSQVRSQVNYSGNVMGGSREGFGRYQWEDGTHYIGQFVKNNMNGYGKMIYKDGKIFRGYWSNNEMNGVGEFEWPNSQLYIGNYKNDQKNGLGMLFLRGKTVIAQFEQGQIVQSFSISRQETI